MVIIARDTVMKDGKIEEKDTVTENSNCDKGHSN